MNMQNTSGLPTSTAPATVSSDGPGNAVDVPAGSDNVTHDGGDGAPEEIAQPSTGHSNNTTNGHNVKYNGNNNGTNNNCAVDAENNRENNSGYSGVNLDMPNQEIIRLIIRQYLHDVGLEKSVKTLMVESNCYLEHPSATKFRENVLVGDWSKADTDLKDLEPLIDSGKSSTITEMKFILLEQKYFEHLDDGNPLDALHVLRRELTPLQHNILRVHQLSSYMMCSTSQDLYQRAKWEGKGITSRALLMERLQTFMPPSVMMSPRRLRTLLQQAVELQSQNCPYHDMAWETNLQTVSLLTDHCCFTDGFPMQTIQVLTDHCDEVWFCKFSPDGLKLATGSKDSTVIIWDVDPYKLTLKHRRTLDGRGQLNISFVSWSPDSKLILVGGTKDSHELFIWNVDDGKMVVKFSQSLDDSLTCRAFSRDGNHFVCGGQKGHIYLCDMNGTLIDSWEGVRVNSIAFRADNNTILAADKHYRIRSYNFDKSRSNFDVLREPHPIMTFSINSSDRLALLNVSNQGLHLWDIEDKCLVRCFHGIWQSNFAIHSCFGGVNESFVASGSEDKAVYIWHLKREEPLAKLAGHIKTVNCVSWNPAYPSLLASASDDATVRIWGPNPTGSSATTAIDDCSSSSSSSSWNMT